MKASEKVKELLVEVFRWGKWRYKEGSDVEAQVEDFIRIFDNSFSEELDKRFIDKEEMLKEIDKKIDVICQIKFYNKTNLDYLECLDEELSRLEDLKKTLEEI